MSRKNPNIIITGTPGTGKTSHSQELAKSTGLKHISVNQVVKEKNCHEGWSDEHQSYIVDEDKVDHSPYSTDGSILTEIAALRRIGR